MEEEVLTAVEDYEDFSKTNQVVQMVVTGKDLHPSSVRLNLTQCLS